MLRRNFQNRARGGGPIYPVLCVIGSLLLGAPACFTIVPPNPKSLPEVRNNSPPDRSTPTRHPTPSATFFPTATPTAAPTTGSITIHRPCPEAPPSQLDVGSTAYVSFLPQVSHPLLLEPGGAAGESSRPAESGEQMSVKDGPECYEGQVWWLVALQNDSVEGWLAESHEGAYLLLPLLDRDLVIAREVYEDDSPLLSGGVIFKDDFDIDTRRWRLDQFDEYSVQIENGFLSIDIEQPRLHIPMLLEDMEFADVRLEVDVWVPERPHGSQFGLHCRHQANSVESYEFQISDRGEVYIYVTVDHTAHILAGTGPRTTEALRPGQLNHLVATCIGQDLRFTVNDELVASAHDDTHESGQVGFFAGTGEIGDARVSFDSFVVSEP